MMMREYIIQEVFRNGITYWDWQPANCGNMWFRANSKGEAINSVRFHAVGASEIMVTFISLFGEQIKETL
jgi:hypothetical protein